MQPFPSQPPVDAKRRRNVRLLLLLTSILFGLLLVPGIGAIMISPMVFASPASQENPLLLAFTIALVSYPVLAVIAIPGSWVAYARRRYSAAMAIGLLPLLPLLAAFICFLLLER